MQFHKIAVKNEPQDEVVRKWLAFFQLLLFLLEVLPNIGNPVFTCPPSMHVVPNSNAENENLDQTGQ